MILHPAVLALTAVGRHYPRGPRVGGPRGPDPPPLGRRERQRLQLSLERRTYLVTTLVSWAFALHLVSLFLFIYLADDLSSLFVGAMCAAGSLALNEFGYPALLLKLANFLLNGLKPCG